MGVAKFPKRFAKEEKKVPEFEFQMVREDLVQLIDKSITRYVNVGTHRGIKVRWRWETKPNRQMYSLFDEVPLAMAIDEVLSNAVKYSFENFAVDVSIGSTSDDRFWNISIRDHGIRIPDDKLKEVFEPGRRLMLEPSYHGHYKAERPGYGMGLAYVKAIVEKHGGQVSITCKPSFKAREYPSLEYEQRHTVVVNIHIPKN